MAVHFATAALGSPATGVLEPLVTCAGASAACHPWAALQPRKRGAAAAPSCALPLPSDAVSLPSENLMSSSVTDSDAWQAL